jgi:hypothetical protein
MNRQDFYLWLVVMVFFALLITLIWTPSPDTAGLLGERIPGL